MKRSDIRLVAYSEHGQLIRMLYLAIAIVWWLGRSVLRRIYAPANRALVLCYHGVSDRQRSEFQWQMSRIAGRSVDLAGPPPHRRTHLPSICVTFDDAFANLLDNALPVTQRLNIPVTIFAVAGNLGDKPLWDIPPWHPEATECTMTPGQLRALTQQPLCRIGSHTMTHPPLGKSTPQAVRIECKLSRERLEKHLAIPMEDLALPYGSWNHNVLAIAHAAGYKRVYTLEPRLQPIGQDGAIGRFSMTPDTWRIEFLLTCAGGYTWLANWQRLVRTTLRLVRPRAQREPSLA